jgi:hypothetical protein
MQPSWEVLEQRGEGEEQHREIADRYEWLRNSADARTFVGFGHICWCKHVTASPAQSSHRPLVTTILSVLKHSVIVSNIWNNNNKTMVEPSVHISVFKDTFGFRNEGKHEQETCIRHFCQRVRWRGIMYWVSYRERDLYIRGRAKALAKGDHMGATDNFVILGLDSIKVWSCGQKRGVWEVRRHCRAEHSQALMLLSNVNMQQTLIPNLIGGRWLQFSSVFKHQLSVARLGTTTTPTETKAYVWYSLGFRVKSKRKEET